MATNRSLVVLLGALLASAPAAAVDDFDVPGYQDLHPQLRLVRGDDAPGTAEIVSVLADDLQFGEHVAPVEDGATVDAPLPSLEVRTQLSGDRLECIPTLRRPSGAEWPVPPPSFLGPPDSARTLAHELAVDVVHRLTGITDTTPLSTLYFLRDAGDHRDLWAADADGGRPRLALSDSVWTLDPVLSPGTDGIAFIRAFKGVMQAWGYWPAAGRRMPLFPGKGAQLGATLTPGGGAVVVQMDPTGRMRLILVTSRGAVALTEPSVGDLTPAITTDGASVLFASGRSGGSQIFRVGLDGRNLVRLTTEPGFFLSPRPLPNGDVALVVRREGRFDIGVWHSHGGHVEILTSGPGDNLDPTPLGPDHLVFASDRDGRRRLYVMKLDGSNQAVLPLSGPGGPCEAVDCSAPVWQPAALPAVPRQTRREQ